MHSRTVAAGTLVALTLVMSASSHHVFAQQAHQAIPMTVHAGEALELGSDTDVSQPELSWYMTQNQQFIEAQRGKIFQKRLATPGTYNLDLSVKNEAGTQSAFQSFTVIVLDQPQALPPLQTGSATTITPRIVTTPPMNSDGSVSLPPEGGVLAIDASQSTGPISQFAIDIDTSKDSDSNGNAADDIDNANTFGIQDGTPLRYYIKPSATQRVIAVKLSGSGVPDAVAQFAIRFDGSAMQLPQGSGAPVDILAQGQGLSINVSANVSQDQISKPLLYEWEFGDGAKSLLTHPEHTYIQPGTYTVSVHVIDITTGQEIFSGQRALTVDQNSEASVSSNSSSVSSSGTTTGGSSLPWKALLILFGLIVVAIIAFVLLMWFKNTMTGTIQKKLETAEKKLFDDKSATSEAPPLQLKKAAVITQDPKPAPKKEQTIVDREEGKTEFKKGEPQSVATSNGPVPSWLKNAPAEQKTEKAIPAPTPAPQKSPAPTAAAPAPKPTPAPSPRPAPVTPSPLAVNPPKQNSVTPPPPSALPPKALPTNPSLPPKTSMQKPASPSGSQNGTPGTPASPAPRPAPGPIAPAPVGASSSPKPSSAQAPTTAKMPDAPSPPPAKTGTSEPALPELPEVEQPIAFIRAESLEKKDEPPVQPYI